jgi:multiple sugar transport system ATP-binding protein
MPVNIVVVEPLGAEIHLSVTTSTQPLIIRTDPTHEYKIGEYFNFIPNMEKARYFDKETEIALVD